MGRITSLLVLSFFVCVALAFQPRTLADTKDQALALLKKDDTATLFMKTWATLQLSKTLDNKQTLCKTSNEKLADALAHLDIDIGAVHLYLALIDAAGCSVDKESLTMAKLGESVSSALEEEKTLSSLSDAVSAAVLVKKLMPQTTFDNAVLEEVIPKVNDSPNHVFKHLPTDYGAHGR